MTSNPVFDGRVRKLRPAVRAMPDVKKPVRADAKDVGPWRVRMEGVPAEWESLPEGAEVVIEGETFRLVRVDRRGGWVTVESPSRPDGREA